MAILLFTSQKLCQMILARWRFKRKSITSISMNSPCIFLFTRNHTSSLIALSKNIFWSKNPKVVPDKWFQYFLFFFSFPSGIFNAHLKTQLSISNGHCIPQTIWYNQLVFLSLPLIHRKILIHLLKKNLIALSLRKVCLISGTSYGKLGWLHLWGVGLRD